ncbi:MAG: hypothetical protein IPL79_19790 [Myxococcales bacterium]|nr:hypothetical protein [Myxococcales bacterium]
MRRVRLHLALVAMNTAFLVALALAGFVAFEVSVTLAGALGTALVVAVAAWSLTRLAVYTTERSLRRLLVPSEGASNSAAIPSRFEITSDDSGMYDLRSTLDRRLAKSEQRRDAARSERDVAMRILESLAHGVVALTPERRVEFCNRRASELLGLVEMGRGSLLIEQVRISALHELIDRAVDGSTCELTTPPGQRLLVTYQRLSEGGVIVIEDVSEVRHLEQIRRDFVANVSHELRTPVSILRATSETLSHVISERPEMAGKLVDSLLRNSERLSNLLSDLLDLARIEAGKLHLQPEVLVLPDLLAEVQSLLAGKLAERQQTLQVEIATDAACFADHLATTQVLMNLIDNAIRYTQVGGHIAVKARQSGTRCIIEVADNGPGILEHHRARIFERFYRVDGGRAREAGGTGLGLSIVKHLCEAMGGGVQVHPNDPSGSRFVVELPANAAK